MAEKGFSIGQSVKFGWKTMKENLVFFIGLLIVTWLIQLAPRFIADNVLRGGFLIKLALLLVAFALQLLTTMGLVRIALKFCGGEKGNFADLFSCLPLLVNYLLSTLLYILILIGGALLLIFPAFIWGVKFGLYPYFIVDKGLGPIGALKASAEATKGAKWDLFGFGFVSGCIVLAGALCLLIGLFAAVPTTLVASAQVYRKLLSQADSDEKN